MPFIPTKKKFHAHFIFDDCLPYLCVFQQKKTKKVKLLGMESFYLYIFALNFFFVLLLKLKKLEFFVVVWVD